MNNKIKSPKGKSNGEKPRDIRDVAARKLSYRARTKAELKKLLSKEEYSENEIDDVIQEFSDLGYLDDVAYSVSYLGYASSKGWADSRGIRELRQKGVSESDIKAAIDKRDEERKWQDGSLFYQEKSEEERALSVAEKMVDDSDFNERGRLEEKVKARIARRLFGYGYKSDIIYSTIRNLEAGSLEKE